VAPVSQDILHAVKTRYNLGVLFLFGKIVKPTERWEVRGRDKRTESWIGQKRGTHTRPHPNFIMHGSLELYEASDLPYGENMTALGGSSERHRETAITFLKSLPNELQL
jgi:hypothetical protein